MKKNSLFYERLMKAIDKSGKSANCIERELGYSRNALHNYKNGTEPSGTRLVELAQYFSISPDYLIGKKDEEERINPTVFFKQFTEEQKLDIVKVSQAWVCSKITH